MNQALSNSKNIHPSCNRFVSKADRMAVEFWNLLGLFEFVSSMIVEYLSYKVKKVTAENFVE